MTLKASLTNLPSIPLEEFQQYYYLKGGKLLGTKVGATSEKDMLEFIQPHI